MIEATDKLRAILVTDLAAPQAQRSERLHYRIRHCVQDNLIL